MTDTSLNRCELFIRNRNTLESAFFWDRGMMHLCCAYLYTMRGKTADKASIKQNKKLLDSRVGAFSNFQSTARSLMVTMLDLSNEPEKLLDNALQLYGLLKNEMFSSSYLPIAAMLLAEQAPRTRYEELASRTGRLMDRLSHNHPWLISTEHYAMCALLAMSGQPDDELIERIERSYNLLKGNFSFLGDEVQSIAHLMAAAPGNVDTKCARVLALAEKMKAAGHKWNGLYELPVLAVLAGDPNSVETVSAEVAANDDWLRKQKGLSDFSFSITRQQRLMYAALLTQPQTEERDLTAIITEQAAILGAMGAAKAAESNRYGAY